MAEEPNFDDWYEKERIHRAAQHGDVREVERLIAVGAAVNYFDEISFTPLHYAAACGHIEVMRVLLRAGADANARQEEMSGDTALATVAYSCSLAVAEFLVTSGADPTIPGWMAVTALDNSGRREDEEGRAVHALLVGTARRLHPTWARINEFA
jgi:ankyrin repeat protein